MNIYIRSLLYEVYNEFYFKDTYINELYDYNMYTLKEEKLKSIIKGTFSILDKISFLLTNYLNLKIKLNKVDFTKIIKEYEDGKIKTNINFDAIYNLYLDLYKDDGIIFNINMKDFRNIIEHREVESKLLDEKEVFALIKIIKNIIIYLVYFIDDNERNNEVTGNGSIKLAIDIEYNKDTIYE